MEKKFLAISVAALMAVQPAAAVLAETAVDNGVPMLTVENLTNSDGGNEGSTETQQTLDDAKAAAEAALEELTVTNDTTADDILNKAKEAITLEDVTAAWSEEEPFTLTEATVEAAGSITGTIVLTKDTETADVAVNLTIAQLEEEPEDPSALADAVAAVEAMLEGYEVDNTKDASTVKAELLSAIQAAAEGAVEGVTAAWAQTEGETPADDVTVTLAGIGKTGLVKGNVVLTKEAISETVAIDLEIAAKKTQSLKDVEIFVETSLKSYKVDNTLENADAVKAAVLAFVQEEAAKAMDGVTASWAQTEEEEPADDVKIIMPTTEKEGSVIGYIVLSAESVGAETETEDGEPAAEPVIVDVALTIDKIVVENQDLLDAQEKIASAVESLYLTNSSQKDKMLQVLDEELGSSDVKLTWSSTDDFQLTPATTTETGSVTGTIVLSLLGQTKEVKVEKVIPVRDRNQITSEDAQDKAEDAVAGISTTVNTDIEDIDKVLSNLFVGSFIDFRWGTGPEKYEKIPSTTSKMGQITGTVYVYEIDSDETADPTSERPVKVSLYLPKKESSSNSRPSSGGSNSSNGGGNSIVISGNNNSNNNANNNNNNDNTTTQEKKFDDLTNYSWAETQINALVEKGVINGVSETEFAPANNIKRADFLVMAMRLAGITDTPADNFDDVAAGSYYYNAVGMAKQLGITSGAGNNQFLPETNITRQDMFVLAYNLLKNQGIITQDADVSVLDSYADAADVADYAKVAVATLLENGFVNGDDTNRINPVNNATRAESAVFLYNVSEKMN